MPIVTCENYYLALGIPLTEDLEFEYGHLLKYDILACENCEASRQGVLKFDLGSGDVGNF